MNIFIGLIIFTLSIILIYFWKLKAKEYDLVCWFFLSYGTMIGFGLVITGFYFEDNVSKGLLIPEFRDRYSQSAFVFIPVSILFMISVFLGGLFCHNLKATCSLGRNRFSSISNHQDVALLRRYSLSALLLFILSFTGYYIYVHAYGGFISYLAYSAAIRSGVFDSLPPNPFSFLIAFGSLSYISSFIYFSLLKRNVTSFFLFMFLISLFFSIYVLVSRVGRVSLLFYILVFLLSFVLKPNDLSPRYFRFFIFSLIFFILLFAVNSILERGAYSGVMQLLSMELIFPIASLLNSLEVSVSFRLGVDLFLLPLYWTPQRFWHEYVVSADAYNTYLLFGLFKGEGGLTGAVPSDILTLSYLNLGYFGFVIFGFFTGCILSICDLICRRVKIKEVRILLYCYLVMNLSVLLPIYADPSHIAARLFPVVSFIIVFYFSRFLLFRIRKF